MNWKTPEPMLTAGPTTDQLLNGNDRLVLVTIVNDAFVGLLVNVN